MAQISEEKHNFFAEITAIDHVESGRVAQGTLPDDGHLREWAELGFQRLPQYRLLAFILRQTALGRPLVVTREKSCSPILAIRRRNCR